MMATFETLLQASLTGACLIAATLLIAAVMGKSLAAKYRRLIWLVIALRLLVPVSLSLPQAPVSLPAPNLRVPVYTAAPKAANGSPAVMPPAAFPGAVAAPAPTAGTPPTVLEVLLALWAVGATGFAAWEIGGHIAASRRLLRWSSACSASERASLDALQSQMGIRRHIALRRSEAVRAPMLLGMLRPVILLPQAPYDAEDLSMILLHELMHYRRGDLWYTLAMLAARTLHWFNPLAYVMVQRAKVDMEFACDDAVVRAIGAGRNRRYGETILAAASAGQGYAAALSTHFGADRRSLADRIRNIMQTKKRRIGALALALILLGTLAGGMVVSFASDDGATPDETATGGQAQQSAKDSRVRTLYGPLLDLRPADYESMTIRAFRDAIHDRIAQDEETYLALYDLFDAEAYALRYTDDDAFFLFNTLIPLTAERWEAWTYANAIVADTASPQDVPMEYSIERTVLDADAVTVGEHESFIRGLMDDIETTARALLPFQAEKQQAAMDAFGALETAYSQGGLSVSINVFFGPTSLMDGAQDETANVPGPMNDAVTPATPDDYAALLTLRTEGFDDMTVAAFTHQVQDAFRDEASQVHGAYERVLGDIRGGRVPDGVSDEDLRFLSLSLAMTFDEYSAAHQSQYSETPVTAIYQDFYFGDESSSWGVTVEYAFSHEVTAPERITVAARDESLLWVIDGMRQALAEGLWNVGGETLQWTLEQLCEEASVPGALRLAPVKVYCDVNTAARDQVQTEAIRLIDQMALIDTALPISAYNERITALCEEEGTNLFQVMSDAIQALDENHPLYAFTTGTLMHTSSELYAAQIGGEERSHVSGWVKRERYGDARADLPDQGASTLESMVQAEYTIFYDIHNPDTLTVEQREARLHAVADDLAAFLNGLPEEALPDASLKAQLRTEIARLAAAHSDAALQLHGEITYFERYPIAQQDAPV